MWKCVYLSCFFCLILQTINILWFDFYFIKYILWCFLFFEWKFVNLQATMKMDSFCCLSLSHIDGFFILFFFCFNGYYYAIFMYYIDMIFKILFHWKIVVRFIIELGRQWNNNLSFWNNNSKLCNNYHIKVEKCMNNLLFIYCWLNIIKNM